jgi:hypothetical protein
MASERTRAALEELKAAMEEDGADPGTVDAQLHGIVPNIGEEHIRGNYADLQRMGAIAQTGTMPTPPGEEDVQTTDITEAFTATNPETQAVDDSADDDVPANGGTQTKADLQAALDEKGIEYTSSATKADLQALLDEG